MSKRTICCISGKISSNAWALKGHMIESRDAIFLSHSRAGHHNNISTRRTSSSFPPPPTSIHSLHLTILAAMAKLSASRQSKNATPDPASATAPAQATRSTRAASREPNEPQTPRRSARKGRSASVESDAAAARTAKITTGAASVTGMQLHKQP